MVDLLAQAEFERSQTAQGREILDGINAKMQLSHGRSLDLQDVNFNAPMAEALLATGDPSEFAGAFQAAALLNKINPTNGSRLLLARACLETGRLARGFSLMKEVMMRMHGKLDAEGALVMSGLYKQEGKAAMAREYLSQAKKQDPEIETKIHLWYRIKPLTPIEQAREEAAEAGKPIVEKEKRGSPKPEPPSGH